MVSIRSLLAYFWVDKPRVLYFVACCGIVLVLAWKYRDSFSRKVFRYIVLPSLLLLTALLNPLIAHLLVTLYEETQSLRFFWLVPASLLMAIVSVRLVFGLRDRKPKILMVVLIPVVLLLLSNGFKQLRGTWQNRITNVYKVPPIVIVLSDWIVNDDADIEKSAVFPQPLNLWVRQYRPEIEMPFEWHRYNKESVAAKQLYRILQEEKGTINLCEVSYWAKEGGYNYIVLDPEKTYDGTLIHYQEVYRVDVDPENDTNAYDREYIVYRLAEEE